MTWTLVWTRPALRDLQKLDRERARRIRDAVVRLVESGYGDLAKLTDVTPPEWRLSVGDQRVFFRYDNASKGIQVLRIRRRDQAY